MALPSHAGSPTVALCRFPRSAVLLRLSDPGAAAATAVVTVIGDVTAIATVTAAVETGTTAGGGAAAPLAADAVARGARQSLAHTRARCTPACQHFARQSTTEHDGTFAGTREFVVP